MHNRFDIYRIAGSQYEVFRSNIIGVGRYSTVYLGRCINPEKCMLIERKDKLVAIKRIDITKLSLNTGKFLITETDINRELINKSHPNIVKCYDVIEDIDVIHIVMEYCDGDMNKLLTGKPFKEKYIVHYFKQFVNAIHFLHQNNIIHRDIKPQNILLNKNQIKLCDFGMSKFIDTNNVNSDGKLKRTNTVCGSPLYMAPEIFEHNGYDDSIDIWSIGIILFEMIYGDHPLSKCKDYDELSDLVTKSDIVIPPTTNVSPECIELLKLVLKKYNYERIRIDDLVNNHWLKNYRLEKNDSKNVIFNESIYLDPKFNKKNKKKYYDIVDFFHMDV